MSITRQDSGQRMSRIVTHNQTVYLCGQVAKDADANISEQTATTLEKIDALLAQAGTDKSKLLSVTIYLADMADFAEMNAVWDQWVTPGAPPARACVQALMARPELKVEMSVIAAL